MAGRRAEAGSSSPLPRAFQPSAASPLVSSETAASAADRRPRRKVPPPRPFQMPGSGSRRKLGGIFCLRPAHDGTDCQAKWRNAHAPPSVFHDAGSVAVLLVRARGDRPLHAKPAATSTPAPVELSGTALLDAPPMALDCAAALLLEPESGQIIFEMNADSPRAVASVTKVMTILLTLEAIDDGRVALDDVVTISESAAGMGGSQVLLDVGETQTVDVLLKSMIVGSANDGRRRAGRSALRIRRTVRRPDERARAAARHGRHALRQLHRPAGRRPAHDRPRRRADVGGDVLAPALL